MSSFTEYVKLITEAGQTLAEIAKVNEALTKLREHGEKPILIKINLEENKVAGAEKKIRDERQKTADADAKNVKQRLADNKAIKAMNAEQGGNPGTVRYGSQKSLEQGRKFNQQLEETTARINKLADAHKHIKQVSAAAAVEVSPKLAETLATQTVNKYDSGVKKDEADRIKAVRERTSQEEDGAKRLIAMEAERVAKVREIEAQTQEAEKRLLSMEAERVAKVRERGAQEEAAEKRVIAMEAERISKVREIESQTQEAEKRVIAMEAERISKVKERQNQELEGEKRLMAMEAERVRKVRERTSQEEEAAKRVIQMHNQAEQEKRKIEQDKSSLNRTGFRGAANEIVRDARRNVVYGGIYKAEEMGSSAFDATKTRSQEIEALYQSGRTPEETVSITANAKRMGEQYPVLSETEGMTLQRHAIGEVGTVKGGEELASLAAPFVALRTAAVGAEGALAENQRVMKAFNDLGWVKDPAKMKTAYDQIAKVTQTESKNWDVGSFLTTVIMLKSPKYGMSEDAITKIAPLVAIGEGAGRAGNEFAMLFKTLAFSGKSLDNSVGKDNHKKYIDGTELSDGKGGFNQQLVRDVAAGTPEGIKDFNRILDSAARKAGVNPEDTNAFQEWTHKVFSNNSANELSNWFHEQIGNIEKQLNSYHNARGISAAEGIGGRDIDTAIAQTVSKFNDASASVLDPFKKYIIAGLNAATKVEQAASNNPTLTKGLAAGAVTAGIVVTKMILDNPSQSANTAAILANTAALGLNTGSRALGSIPGGVGAMSATGILMGIGAAIYDVKLGMDDWKQYKTNQELKKIFTDPDTNKKFNEQRVKEADDEAARLKPTLANDDPATRLAYEHAKESADWKRSHAIRMESGVGGPQEAIDNARANSAPYYNANKSIGIGASLEYTHDKQVFPEIKPFDSDKFWSPVKDAASSAEDAVGGVGKKISGAGNSIISALEGIAAEIAGVKISSPQAAATGKQQRGPQ